MGTAKGEVARLPRELDRMVGRALVKVFYTCAGCGKRSNLPPLLWECLPDVRRANIEGLCGVCMSYQMAQDPLYAKRITSADERLAQRTGRRAFAGSIISTLWADSGQAISGKHAPPPAPAEWADVWPPTAREHGWIVPLREPERPCARCGGDHEYMTSGCITASFVGDTPMTITGFPPPIPVAEAPDGLHVIEWPMGSKYGSETRYAVIRHAQPEPVAEWPGTDKV